MEKKRIDFTFDDQSLQPRKQFEALQHDAKLSNLLPAQAGSFHAGRWPAEAHWTVRVYKPGYFALRPSGSATAAPTNSRRNWSVPETFYVKKENCS